MYSFIIIIIIIIIIVRFLDADFVSSIQIFTFAKKVKNISNNNNHNKNNNNNNNNEVFLENVYGLWKLPSGEWERKIVLN